MKSTGHIVFAFMIGMLIGMVTAAFVFKILNSSMPKNKYLVTMKGRKNYYLEQQQWVDSLFKGVTPDGDTIEVSVFKPNN